MTGSMSIRNSIKRELREIYGQNYLTMYCTVIKNKVAYSDLNVQLSMVVLKKIFVTVPLSVNVMPKRGLIAV